MGLWLLGTSGTEVAKQIWDRSWYADLGLRLLKANLGLRLLGKS